jgi:ABC-type dipeptide/oligopeptide/nickel transport system ATPase component
MSKRPILEVRDLRTYFFPEEGTVRAVDGAHLDVYPRRTLGIVGESGCGKSVTARSILRIIERPGRIVSGSILLRRDDADAGVDLAQLTPDGREMRRIRGEDIALIFQEPMTSFSPVHTIGSQIVETVRLHQGVGKRQARERAVEALRLVGCPAPSAASTSTPSSSRGACASGP